MDVSTAVAVKAAYMHAFDSFATDPTAIAELPQIGNVRYAREILGLLVTNYLVAEDEVNGGESVWQVIDPGTYDTCKRDDAEKRIDEWLAEQGVDVSTPPAATPPAPTKATAKPRPKANTNPADLPFCRCGCGQNVGRKSNYKPGHDARHAGQIARSIADSGDFSLLTELPSEALETKARDMAERLIGKAAPAPTPEPEPEPEPAPKPAPRKRSSKKA